MDFIEVRPGEAEFRGWYLRTSPRVFAYVRRYCTDADCDDVISEVYLVAWRKWAELPPDSVPWLIGTARNVLANSWRARVRRRRLEMELAGLEQLAADPAHLAVERADLVRTLGELSADDREVLLLVGWDGLDSTGVAAVLGCSVAAARTRLSRARRRLSDHLGASIDAPTTLLRLVPEGN